MHRNVVLVLCYCLHVTTYCTWWEYAAVVVGARIWEISCWETESQLMIMYIVAWLWRNWSQKPLHTSLFLFLFLLLSLVLALLRTWWEYAATDNCSRGRLHQRNILLRNWVTSDNHVYCCMVVKKLITKTSTHLVVFVAFVVVFRLLSTHVYAWWEYIISILAIRQCVLIAWGSTLITHKHSPKEENNRNKKCFLRKFYSLLYMLPAWALSTIFTPPVSPRTILLYYILVIGDNEARPQYLQ